MPHAEPICPHTFRTVHGALDYVSRAPWLIRGADARTRGTARTPAGQRERCDCELETLRPHPQTVLGRPSHQPGDTAGRTHRGPDGDATSHGRMTGITRLAVPSAPHGPGCALEPLSCCLFCLPVLAMHGPRWAGYGRYTGYYGTDLCPRITMS